jgi:hypothetical protein
VDSTNVALGFAHVLSTIGGIFDTIMDPDLSGWEKFTSVLSAIAILIPTIFSLVKSLKDLFS